ncbi:glucokinase [Paramagnetospirillum kuznetsovii]|uniref:Glucokinase n=1 Tax=Paramagnetospirillum kuznetsovii TaxID=2053833 RepID=A0A364NW82_9PROT|nr:glucokinase [Paramagnetospirillum kuznetsovii]RAU21341.1 glucokinase [Paramagnetospirillum kuznetsovii]
MKQNLALVADIGGTHARFALVEGGEVLHPTVLRCADYDGPASAAKAYLDANAADQRPTRAAFAVASAITGDRIELTNSPWRFSIEATRQALGLERLEVVNDFTAVALSVRHLTPDHLVAIGGGAALPGLPIAVLGPGTGLGASAVIPDGKGGWTALATEGGHVTMAAANDREAEILGWLRRRFDHVSAERVLSGQGLVNLYQAIAALSGRQAVFSTPDVITQRGLDGSCPISRETVEVFFAMMGTVTGNLALTLGARGGVFIAGGILPRMADAFKASGFRARFEEHGRFQPYLAAIPTWLVVHALPAFIGLAALVAPGENAPGENA